MDNLVLYEKTMQNTSGIENGREQWENKYRNIMRYADFMTRNY